MVTISKAWTIQTRVLYIISAKARQTSLVMVDDISSLAQFILVVIFSWDPAEFGVEHTLISQCTAQAGFPRSCMSNTACQHIYMMTSYIYAGTVFIKHARTNISPYP